MEQYNDFVDLLEHGSAKYEQQLPALHKKFIAQLQEQGKLPPEVQSYAQLSQEQRPLVDDLIDEHFAAIDPTIPLVFDSFKCLDLNVDLEKQLLKFWQPIFSNSTAFKRNGKLSPAEISQVEQFRKKIRRQSVEHLCVAAKMLSWWRLLAAISFCMTAWYLCTRRATSSW